MGYVREGFEKPSPVLWESLKILFFSEELVGNDNVTWLFKIRKRRETEAEGKKSTLTYSKLKYK